MHNVGVLEENRQYIRHIAYDGGAQSSFFYPFDGDYAGLRKRIESGQERADQHFWSLSTLFAHYLKRDHAREVLVIGSGGGQETKAALMYGAAHVDAVEMVGTILQLGRTTYAEYTGGVYNNPRVTAIRGEGRSFLSASGKNYDIIQEFSNSTTSGIAKGYNGAHPQYLTTLEAFEDYFAHLSPDGILQINNRPYPKLVEVAAAAWRAIGKGDFRSHVVVLECAYGEDRLPTLLIKMSPWTVKELADIRHLMTLSEESLNMVVDPLHPAESFLSDDFFSGQMPRALKERLPYNLEVPTDDRPYFSHLHKGYAELLADPADFVSISTALMVNNQIKASKIQQRMMHIIWYATLIIIGIMCAACASWQRRRTTASHIMLRLNTLVYFGCLGVGFILMELTLIQMLLKCIGYPLYAYSTVIFSLLISAGLGAPLSAPAGISDVRRWLWPFIAILLAGALLVWFLSFHAQQVLTLPVEGRIIVVVLCVLPLGFFLGMPFPIGIITLRNLPRTEASWAWACNSIFTAVGGVCHSRLTMHYGFLNTFMLALLLYAVALAALAVMHKTVKWHGVRTQCPA